MDLHEMPGRPCESTSLWTGTADGGAHGDTAVAYDLGCHIPDATDVDVAILAAKAEAA